MLFNSYIFILAFLPLCLIGFHGLKTRYPQAAKLWVIAMSLWFYGYFNIRYLLIMLFSIAFNYAMFTRLKRQQSRLYMIAGTVVNLGVLFYFKYFDFFLDTCNTVFGTKMPLRGILLPLGISFFTFQQIGFLADTYRGEITKCNPIDYVLFVTFFPQLIAGPIVNYDEMIPQFEQVGKLSDYGERFQKGIYIFILGLAKKVLIADMLGGAVDYAYGIIGGHVSAADMTAGIGISATESLLVILLYTLQLYFDFSGYCDMAIGLGQMLGIDIPVNFNSPYKAVNIVDFWKRWHITLSRFFTKNIYIPLGGNRRGKGRMYANLFIVFLLSGIWHGAGWNFILWGCMHGVAYVITRAFPKIKSRLLTFVFVNLAWVYFRAPSVTEANMLISNLWRGNWTAPGYGFTDCFNGGELWYALKVFHLTGFEFSRFLVLTGMTLFALLTAFLAPNVHELADRTRYRIQTAILLGILFVWCMVSLSGVSTFLYFNF